MGYRSIKTKIKSSLLVVWIRVFLSKWQETNQVAKNLCISGICKDPIKLKTHLTIAVHALEKGMSIGKARYGFGKAKALELLNGLEYFIEMGGEKVFVDECCTIIERYLEYNERNGADMLYIKEAFGSFCNKHNIRLTPYGGTIDINHSDIIKSEHSLFDIFSQSRYAIRDFGNVPIKKEFIEKALKLCERTPTACNRQSQRIHVYLNPQQKDKILSMQGGARGFDDDMQGAILVCSDLRCYDFFELNLPYVDGALYAMNLLYSLHFYDIATIPLTMGHKTKYTRKLMAEMGLPSNEVPVLLIGIGSFKEKWRVAQSHRKNWREYSEIVE